MYPREYPIVITFTLGLMIEPKEMSKDPPPASLPLEKPLLSRQSSPSSAALSYMIGIQTQTWEEFVLSLLNKSAFSRYSLQLKSNIAVWILSKQRFYTFSSRIHSTLKNLAFGLLVGLMDNV